MIIELNTKDKKKKVRIEYEHEYQSYEDEMYPDHSRDARDYATDLMW